MIKSLATTATIILLPAAGYAAGLDDLAKAMGADKVQTIEFSGTGLRYAVGQSVRADKPWPKFNLKSYKATIDYGGASMRQAMEITQGEHPPRGGGRQPVKGVRKSRGGISGDVGWGFRRGNPRPARFTAGMKHRIWTSPHGIIKAAQAQGAKIKPRTAGGKSYKTVSIAGKGAFTATGWFDKRNLLVAVESRVAHAVLGDMPVVTLYSKYKDFGGVKFPTKISTTSLGYPSFELSVTDVKANVSANIIPPKKLRRGGGERVKVDKITDGVWYLTGGSHHSIAIEMSDHVVVFETPLHDRRTAAVIKAIKETVPGKPIRYAVNTHHHSDHSGGVRRAAAEGATIVTHESNRPYFEAAHRAPHKISPDALARSGKKLKIMAVGDKLVMRDASRPLELYRLVGNQHNAGLLIGYLPKEKIVMVADAYSGRGFRKSPAKNVIPYRTNFWENLKRLQLDIEIVLPIHGRKTDIQQVRFAAGAQ
jgi:glyoxylase-like metal-dependent hydrolase (beta-lactamase superfamily II)